MSDFIDTLGPLLRTGDERAVTLLEHETADGPVFDYIAADALRPAVEAGVPRAVVLFKRIVRRSPDVDPDGKLLRQGQDPEKAE